MSKFENPFKQMAVAGAIALNACAPGAGERAEVNTAQDAQMEQPAENSPEAVQDRLLDGMKLGLNDLGEGNVVLVAIESGLSVDGAEDFLRRDLERMKIKNEGYVFLPVSGESNYEKASDGRYYVVMKMSGVRQ